jgi:hypothetical protein
VARPGQDANVQPRSGRRDAGAAAGASGEAGGVFARRHARDQRPHHGRVADGRGVRADSAGQVRRADRARAGRGRRRGRHGGSPQPGPVQ